MPLPSFSWLPIERPSYSEPWENNPVPELVPFSLFWGSILDLKYATSCLINTYLPLSEGLDYTSKWQQRDGLHIKMFHFLRLVFRCFIAVVEIGMTFNTVRMQENTIFLLPLNAGWHSFMHSFIECLVGFRWFARPTWHNAKKQIKKTIPQSLHS